MAIAFANVSIHTRAKGHSAVAASSYRSGTKLYDSRTGITHDFSNRHDVVFSTILLPEGCVSEFENREFLWNQAELAEKRRDAQVSKDIVLALPKELDLTHQIELAKRFAQTHFVENGLPADIAIHDHGDGNPHAHILITTRRLERDQFSKYKARDLNPSFYSGKVMEQDYWGEQWRDAQNEFFKDKNIDLTVDLNHLVPERHEGKIRGLEGSYLKQDNELIREERLNIAMNHVDNLINHISMTHSVFTRRDIEKLLFKTLTQSQLEANQFPGLVEKILQHKDLIYLGINDDGKESYTTRHQYIAESKLLQSVEDLISRKGHVFGQKNQKLAEAYQLNEEQRMALDYVAEGSDLSVLIGRPGVGKSYLLKPLKEHYEANACRVLGASLSGKVAKALQAETGINSYTLASLNYRLQKKSMTLTEKDVIIVDEAGMVDFASLSSIIESANKAKAKVVLVGDPDQLKPIHKGEIFRGIASLTGYMELSQIRRQNDLGDRQASLMLAKGQIQDALAHYDNKGAICFSETVQDSATLLVHDWQMKIHQQVDTQENMMFAFSRVAVATLNSQAREVLQQKEIVSKEEFVFELAMQGNDNSMKEIRLAQGERILLRKNDSSLGVRNGDMAFIESINSAGLKARLDSGELITLPKAYHHIDYGYATTVHKGQGMTVDNASVLIDSKYWDRFLSFVAMTRHRNNLTLYADKHQHLDLNALNKTLSRSSTKDNVIDWPLDLAIRHGFESDSLIGRVINHLAGIGHKIKEKYNYIVNYEAYAHQQMVKTHRESKQQIRAVAKKVADYLDEQSKYIAIRRRVMKQAEELKIDASSHKEFSVLYAQSVARDAKAHVIWNEHSDQMSEALIFKKNKEDIQRASERHERYLVIKEFAEQKIRMPVTEQLIKRSEKINLEQDKIHVMQLASQFNKNPSELFQQIETAQKANRQLIFAELKQNHPVLAEFDKLSIERSKVTGFKAEQLDKMLGVKALEITKDKVLYTQLQRELPKFARLVALKITTHDLGAYREI